ncbi:hypothetical protein BsWGS_06752 [Bradybaena similaris]
MSKLCAKCGKPVYFAERKTSLGKEWHPNCLKCIACGKVLSPGQHAEHKGCPYCHNPCYRALFGPSMLGYGSNISSPANFAKADRPACQRHDYHNGTEKKEIFSNQHMQSNRASSALQAAGQIKGKTSHKLREILEKIKDFNKYYEGKVHHQMTAHEKDDGSVHVEGPLRIYWGLSRPIQLVHCDNIPPAPISQWRHSLCVGPESPDIPEKRFSMSMRRPGSPPRKSRELDDILTPSSPDDVVRRQKKVRKFKTVAYRGDQPTKWKRASINGHVFNYDTSVFTPVLGSCTSVTVDGTLNCSDVIETLLDKFKVQNSPDEYVLSVVTEEGERLLTHSDKPLLERLKLGPEETLGKIFIKERHPEDETLSEHSNIKMPIVETGEEENLPHEVEQLLVLPEAVLRGILAKYYNDEEREVTLVKARYETAKRRIEKRLYDMQAQHTSSTA